MNFDALIGFSANPEVVGVYDSACDREKLPLLEFRVDLSGAAADVATALQKLGRMPHLMGLTGTDHSDEDALFQIALEKARLSFTPVRVLDRTSIAFLPVDKTSRPRVAGRTGTVTSHAATPIVTGIANGHKGAWRVATGVRVSDVEFASSLYTDAEPGKRVLSPHHTACASKLHGFDELLRSADLFVLNEQEWKWIGGGAVLSDFHCFGPKLIIVTQGESGGMYSLRGRPGEFHAAQCPDKAISSVGAGDWFLGALVHSFLEHERHVGNIDVSMLESYLAFAAKVAAKKVTMPGAANGPTLEEV